MAVVSRGGERKEDCQLGRGLPQPGRLQGGHQARAELELRADSRTVATESTGFRQSRSVDRDCIRSHHPVERKTKMAKNEKTSPAIAKIASKALKGEPVTKTEIKKLAGSVLTQAPDRKKGR